MRLVKSLRSLKIGAVELEELDGIDGLGGRRARRSFEDRHLAEYLGRLKNVECLFDIADDLRDFDLAGLDEIETVARLVFGEDDLAGVIGAGEAGESAEVSHVRPPRACAGPSAP
jgi:hypothetical protein